MDTLLLLVGFAVPWALGAGLVTALQPRSTDEAGRGAWTLGSGFFVGVLLLTLWMRALSALGIPFGVLSIGGPLLVAAVVAMALAFRRGPPSVAASARAVLGEGLQGAARLAWIALLAWIAVRFALLAIDVLMRPLYPWDAWNQWATKARVWFEYRRIVPFVDATTWFTLPTGAAFTDAAPGYPATVPLLQVWGAIVIGRFDDALINMPWWLAGIALALAIHGGLRGLGLGPLRALVGAWIVVSLPILDVHVALAGYADLWVACFVAIAALAMLRAVRSRRLDDVFVAVMAALGAMLVKNPGIVWVATLVPGLVVALMPRRGPAIVAIVFAAAAALLAFAVRTGGSILGYHLQADFHLPWYALGEAWLMFGNWNLLFYGVVAAALLANRRLIEPPLAALTAIVAAGLAFLFFGFAFTNAGAWVEDQSTVNRATLHLAPLLVVFMLLAFRAFESGRVVSAARPAADAA